MIDVRRGADRVVLCGPPCAGKSTYARRFVQPGDEIVDYDAIYAEISGLQLYDQPYRFGPDVRRAFAERAAALRRGWILRSAPDAAYRAALRAKYFARSIVLATRAEICVARLEAADRPAAVKAQQRTYIFEWWATFTAADDPNEAVLR